MTTVFIDFDALVLQEIQRFSDRTAAAAEPTQEQKDELLLTLDTLLESNVILDRALDAVDKGLVTLVRCPASRRAAFQVQSSFSKGREARKSEAIIAASGEHGSHDTPGSRAVVDPIASGINSTGCYTVLPHFCSCADFTFSVLASLSGRRFCKHLLAVAIASCLNKYSVRDASDAEVTALIELPA